MVMPSIQPTQWHIVEASYWQSVYGITWRCHSAKTARWWSHRDVKEPNAVQYCIILYYPKWIQKHVITIFAGLVTFLSGGCYTDYTGDRWLYMAIHGYTWLYITLNMAIHYTKPYYTIDMLDQKCQGGDPLPPPRTLRGLSAASFVGGRWHSFSGQASRSIKGRLLTIIINHHYITIY
jgi:hypothetical protein